MMRAFVLALLLAGCQSGAFQRILQPPALAATWIGIASDGLTWYRLDLDDSGTGVGATANGQETTLYRVRRWSDAEEMTIHLEVADGAADAPRRLDLRGSSEPWRLDLVVEGRHSLTLWREDDLLAARERMMGRGAANPP